MSPIAFAIFFGGEMTDYWSLFWKFMVKAHPSINPPVVTIISDQNMGCIATLANHVPQARHFHCAWHWHQNITKTCGGSASMPGNSLWTNNLLVGRKTMANHHSGMQLPGLFPTNRHYLSKRPNEVQYPTASCAMSEDAFIYGLCASSGSESMN